MNIITILYYRFDIFEIVMQPLANTNLFYLLI